MSDMPSAGNEKIRRPPPHPGLDLVRATEAAALTAGRWMGRGDRVGADFAAQAAMARTLNLLPMKGHIVSGEEGKVGDNSPLKSHDILGTGQGPALDLEVNAIDGANLVASGKPGAISVAALSPPGTMWVPEGASYMEKLVVDRSVASHLTPEVLDAPPAWTLAIIAREMGKDIRDMVVFILERARHQQLIDDVRQAGARVFLRPEGDVGGALMAASPDSGIDVLMGIGGAAEGLITACCVKAIGGAMLARVTPQSETEEQACRDANVDLTQVLTCDEMVKTDDIFVSVTGVTDDVLLRGVHYTGNTVDTHSLVLRSDTGTRRIINTEHLVK